VLFEWIVPQTNFHHLSFVRRLLRSKSNVFWLVLPVSILFSPAVQAQVPSSAYVNFEGAQTNPVRMSTDGTRLYAVNTPDARLSVFDITLPSSPILIAEIPVGIEPVSVNPRTNDEVWVVNQESDSVSVVSVSKKIVTDTIYVKDEPADVVFEGSNAFVSASRSNAICVFDTATHALVKTIPVFGGNPRALALSLDGKYVYAAFALSGNGTTIIPATLAPPQSPPTNPALPPAPQVGLIVKYNDPNWASAIHYTMPDNDVVAIDTTSLSVVHYFAGAGTINLGLAVRPLTGEIYVANTDARNLVHFETFPNLHGHWVDNRITRISSGGQLAAFDLNPGVDYTLFPNPTALANALAQPTAIVFHPSGLFMYVAAFGTDRIGVLDSKGSIISRIELEPTAIGAIADPKNKRGPRGLALNAPARRLYVLNRISNTISIVDTSQNTVIGEMPVGSFDPTPLVIRNGRGFLYDAKLSGNGTGSCASCHVDADMDHLAWDLGNPSGDMITVVQGSRSIQMHPMKGPMVTQTLRGLDQLAPYHWRGDKAGFNAFNPAFDKLMGGSQLSTSDMQAYTNFINTIVFQPNPSQNLDRTFPATLLGGNPTTGFNTFATVFKTLPERASCNLCHLATPGPGSNRFIQQAVPTVVDDDQPLKVPQLRNLYQKRLFNSLGPLSIDGFGFDHDGHVTSLPVFLGGSAFSGYTATQKADLHAFMLCFDTGTAPAVGYTRTITGSNVSTPAVRSDWIMLQNQAVAGNVDLIGKGTIDGQIHGLLYQPLTQNYMTDKTGLGPFTALQLAAKIVTGDTLTLMGVPAGSGIRMGVDRNLDGILDGDAP
jgi:YVTN family beta-propeller protein